VFSKGLYSFSNNVSRVVRFNFGLRQRLRFSILRSGWRTFCCSFVILNWSRVLRATPWQLALTLSSSIFSAEHDGDKEHRRDADLRRSGATARAAGAKLEGSSDLVLTALA
jgi:hypothetical protein